MANTFPTASTAIRRLADLGIEAIPGHKFSSVPGFYVLPGLAHFRGPMVQIQGDNQEWLACQLATILDEAGWDVDNTTSPIRVIINSIPKKGR